MKANAARRSGFTIIELVVAISLILLITAIGAPNFKSLYERTELQRASGEFSNALRYAQQRAVMERNPIRLVIDVDNRLFYVPVEQDDERRQYSSRSRRSRSRSSSRRSNRRVREVKAIQGKLPDGFIYEFVYKVAEDEEIRRGEGEIYFYPDGSADASYITLLRLAEDRYDEKRVFIKIDPATGQIQAKAGRTEEEGSDFYRGYDEFAYR